MNTLPSTTTLILQELSPTYIDLAFPAQGTVLPKHHAYMLYSALCRIIPEAHADLMFRMNTIAGINCPDQNKILLLPGSLLKLRMPAENMPVFLRLAGKQLDIEGNLLRLGVPSPSLLRPSASLYSRIVIIKGFTEEDTFIQAVQRQLSQLDIHAESFVPRNKDKTPQRRILKIKDQSIVGFSVLLTGLSVEDSIKVQAVGIGGKPKMGAGFFVPIKE
jgi:CRISPR-associated protein Cas6